MQELIIVVHRLFPGQDSSRGGDLAAAEFNLKARGRNIIDQKVDVKPDTITVSGVIEW